MQYRVPVPSEKSLKVLDFFIKYDIKALEIPSKSLWSLRVLGLMLSGPGNWNEYS